MNDNDKNKIWLQKTFPEYLGRVLKGEVKEAYLKAEMLLNGWDKIIPRSCGCSMGQLKAEVDIKYSNWLQYNGKTKE